MEINGKIKTISNGNEVILPITSTKAVLDENGKSLDSFIEDVNKMKDITPFNIKGKVNSVDDLPLSSEKGDLYFVSRDGEEDSDEYVWTEDGWEIIGNTDLSGVENKVKENSETLGYVKSDNLFDRYAYNYEDALNYYPLYVGNVEKVTMSTNMPYISNHDCTNLFLLSGNVTSGASSPSNGVSQGTNRTVNVVDGYVTIVIINRYDVNPYNYNIMLNVGEIALPYAPYKPSVDERINTVSSLANENSMTLGHVRKNLFNHIATSGSSGNVTWTVNPNRSITINSTGELTSQFLIDLGKIDLSVIKPNEKYILSGCPDGGGYVDKYAVYLYRKSNFTTFVNSGDSSEAQFTMPNEECYAGIVIRKGITVNNLTFEPMIRLASITDNTYESYESSVDERINNLSSLANESRITLGYSGKNFLNYDAKNKSIGYATMTVNNDKTIDITITNKQDTTVFDLISKPLVLPYGTYILTTGNYYPTKGDIRIQYAQGGSAIGTRTPFVIDTNHTISKVLAFVYKDVENSSLHFEPMIRPVSITDDTYEPYKPSVDERLNEFKNDKRLYNNDDLNNIVDFGRYSARDYGVAQSIINAPVPAASIKPFCVEVTSAEYSTGRTITQKLYYTNYFDGTFFVRNRYYDGSGWNSWYKFTGTKI